VRFENTYVFNHFPGYLLAERRITGASALIFNTRRFRRPFSS